MAWTETTRPHYERRCPRYASDLTDEEWAQIEPLIPSPNRIGRPRKTDLREVVNALLYMASSGGAWRLLPKDFPPFSTVQKYFYRWRDDGLLRTINNELVMAAREREGRAKTSEINFYIKGRRQEIDLEADLRAAQGKRDDVAIRRIQNKIQSLQDSYKAQ